MRRVAPCCQGTSKRRPRESSARESPEETGAEMIRRDIDCDYTSLSDLKRGTTRGAVPDPELQIGLTDGLCNWLYFATIMDSTAEFGDANCRATLPEVTE
jgi:hypothetical protein